MQLLRVILPRGKGSAVMKILKNNWAMGISCYYGYGTAHNTLLNTLHTDKIKKEIVMAILNDDKAKEILDNINDKISKSNTAIAFTSPINYEGETNLNFDIEYVAMYVIVDRHLGQEAVNIAQAKGAKGATLVHGRGAGKEVKSILMHMNIEPEKDIVVMLIKKELMEPIKNAIYNEMNLGNENKGIIYTLPVMEVRGLVEQEN